ncbi:MAG TPA: MCE family protein [Nocardioidaceae bacterium]|nr:MCE family protein [Nocardioidaceae bacterium]
MNRTSKGYRTAIAIEHRMFGVAFLALLVFFGWLTYAIFNKQFTDYVKVDLLASKTGLQLPDNADVKIRGVLVGTVRAREVTDDGVRLSVGLDPDMVGLIPAGVTARIIPKTLFGEKYVALQVPAAGADTHIEAGDVIEQGEVAIEVEQVLNDFYPLLRAVQPAEINYTLTAVSTALEGRGEEIGANLAVLDDYLKQVNPQIPALVEDLRLLSEVSDTYRQVLPEVARFLRNSVTTGNTFVAKEQKIQALFADVAGFSATSRDFLQQHGDNIIRLGELGQAQLPTFAKYSPEYPCLLEGIVGAAGPQAEAFRGYTLHINLEVLPNQPRGYTPADDPVYGDKRGPNCLDLPADPYSQANLPPVSIVPDLVDGVDEPTGKLRPSPTAGVDLTSGFAGTAAERRLVNTIAAPVMGVPVDQVPDIGSLLFGPLARGTEVTLR